MTQEATPTVKIAVAGTGFGSRVQIPGFLRVPGVEISAVMSSGRYERATEVARQYNIPQICHTYEELLQTPGLDAVSIATPPYQHREMTLAAFAAGKHVLCEKPMARTLDEAHEMREAARSTGLVAMIDHEFRYVPARAYLKELIQQDWLGQLYNASITMYTGASANPHTRPFGWLFDKEAGGGFLGALGSHYIDAMRQWFGDISAVCADIDTAIKERSTPQGPRLVTADDNFTLMLRFARGGRGLIQVSAVSHFGEGERMEFYGSKGSLILDQQGQILGGKIGENQRLHALPLPDYYKNGLSSDDPRLRPFVTLATDFVEAVRTAKQAGKALHQEIVPSFNDGYKVQQILEAARQSAETNCWVSLPPPRQ